ncbi:putative enzyme [Vibrio chagasii]|nr:putative enzyme [Vibrio chagasii]
MKATVVIDHEVSAKETKRGKRVWFRSDLLDTRCKVKLGDKFKVVHSANKIRMVRDPNGTLSITNSRGKLSFDLHNKKVAETFNDSICRVFIEVSYHEIVICIRRSDERLQARINNFKERMKRKESLLMGDLCSGIGGLAHSIASGFNRVGQGIRCAFAVDHHFDIMESAALTNPTYDENTIIMNCSLEQAPLERMPQLDLLVTGLSCKAATRQAGGKKLSLPEFHEEAGWLAMALPTIIEKTNPLVMILENVVEWFSTASRVMLERLMTRLGYEVKEQTLNDKDFGAIEARTRGALVFVTKGIELDLELPEPTFNATPVVEVLDDANIFPPVPSDINCEQKERKGWYPKVVLEERTAKKKEQGKGHKAKVIAQGDLNTTTIGASYGKGVRLDESVVESECGQWLRLATPAETARFKGLPEVLASNLPKTTAYIALGNSVGERCWNWLGGQVAASFKLADESLQGYYHDENSVVEVTIEKCQAHPLRSKREEDSYMLVAELADGRKVSHNRTFKEDSINKANALIEKIMSIGSIDETHWIAA